MTDLVRVDDADVVDAELMPDAETEFRQHIEMWLTARAKSPHTRTAYVADSNAWLRWCAANGVEPMDARKTDVEKWHRQVALAPTRKTRRPPAQATLARMVSTIASLYEFLVDQDVLEVVPVRGSTRPRAPKESTTVGLSAQETVKLRAQTAGEGARTQAEIDLMVVLGVRVSELSGLMYGSYGWNKGGRRTLQVFGKGAKTRTLVVDRGLRTSLDGWIAELAAALGVPAGQMERDQLLFPNRLGGPMSQQSVMRTVHRLAKAAGVESWEKISPHSLRHTAATNMLDAGVEIHKVQQVLGHEDVSTTQRYDRARGAIERVDHAQATYFDYLAKIAAELTEETAA